MLAPAFAQFQSEGRYTPKLCMNMPLASLNDAGMRRTRRGSVEVCRYFGSRDRINHVHFRNLRTRVPREKYTEVFPDEGEVER